MAEKELIFGIKVETTEAQKSTKALQKNLKDTGKEFEALQKQVDATSGSLDDFQKNVNKVEKNTRGFERATEKQVKALKDLNKNVSAAEKQLKQISNLIPNLVSGFDLFGSAIGVVTNPENIARLEKITNLLSLIADVKGLDRTSNFLNAISDDVGKFGERVDDLVGKEDIFLRLAAEVDGTAKAYLFLKDAATFGATALKTSGKAAFTILDVFEKLFDIITDVTEVLRIIGDPKLLRNIQKGARLLQFFLAFKGFDFLAEIVNKVANGIGFVAEQSERLQESIENFQKLKDAAQETGQAIEIFAKAVIVTANAGVLFFTTKIVLLSSRMIGLTEIIEKKANAAFNKLKLNAFSVIEVLALMSPILRGIGERMQESEKIFISFIGVLITATAVISEQFFFVLKQIASAIGSFVEDVGFSLLRLSAQFERAFAKGEQTTKAFAFTIESFAATLGDEAVGNLENWNRIVAETARQTGFASGEIQKSIKLLVAEGTSIGLSFKENQDLLAAALDISASSGRQLEDVTQALLSGLVGQTQAARTLGIDLTAVGLSHSKLVEATGKTVDELTEEELVVARLATIFERANILQGAAIELNNTILGQEQKRISLLGSLEEKLGQAATAQTTFLKVQNSILDSLNQLPNFLFGGISALIDLGGVLLVVLGFIIKNIFAIGLLTSALKVLNQRLNITTKSFAILQGTIKAFNQALGLQTASLSNAKDIFKALGNIIKTGLTIALKGLISKIGVLLGLLKGLVIAVVANPLFAAGLAIAAGIAAVVAAAKELEERFGIFTQILDAIKTLFGDFSEEIKIVETGFAGLIRVVKNVGIILLSGILTPVLLVIRGLLELKKALTSDEESLLAIEGQIAGVENQMINLADSVTLATNELNPFAAATAVAAEKQRMLSIELKKNEEQVEKNKKTFEEITGSIDRATLKASIFGEQFVSAGAKVVKANKELKNLEKSFEGIKLGKEEIEKLKEANDKVAESELELQKLTEDTFKNLQQQSENAKVKRLRDNGELAAAAKIESENALKQLELVFAQLVGTNKFEGKRLENLIKIKKALEENAKAAVGAAKDEERIRKQKPALDELKKITEKNEKMARRVKQDGLSRIELIEEERKRRIKSIEDTQQKLKETGALEGKMGKARMEELERAKQLTDELSDKEKERAAIQRGGEVSAMLEEAGGIADALGFGDLGEQLSGFAVDFGLGAAGSFITAVLAVPDILAGAADFLDKITNIGPNIAEALQKFATAILDLITKFVPNLINSLGSILDTVIRDLLIGIPDAFIMLSEAIPEALAKLFEQLPALTQDFVRGFIVRLPKIAIAFVNLIIKLLIKAVPALVKALPAIGEAIVLGVIEAILEIADLITKLFSGEALADVGTVVGESVGEGLKASSSEVFQVIDLEQQRLGKDAGQFIVDGTEKSINLWRRFWEFVDRLWENIINNLSLVWETIIGALEDVWNFIRDAFLTPFIDGVAGIFKFIGENIFGPIIEGFKSVFNLLSDAFTVFVDAFKEVWSFVETNIIGPLGDVFTQAVNVFASILNPIIDVLNNIKIPGVSWSVSAGRLGSWSGKLFDDIVLFDIPKIATAQTGGLVGGQGEGDIIPMLLEPGEFVLNRGAVQGLGLPAVQALNRGEGTAMGTTINFAPNINVSSQDFNPREIIEQMFTELRRRSSNGTKVVFAQGIKS